MRTRITVAFVALLAVALVLAGGVSLLLVRHEQSESAQQTVFREATALVAGLQQDIPSGDRDNAVIEQTLLSIITSVVGLHEVSVITVASTRSGAVLESAPPAGIPASRIDLDALAANRATYGTFHHLAFAAVPLFQIPAATGSPARTEALVFEARESFSAASADYFLLAGGISLLAAAALATIVSRHIARRVVAVAEAAEAIAGGDLATRVETFPRDYPELARLDHAINTMAEDLEAGQRAERDFLLSISHDLRTPLTSIRGFAEAIADGATPDPARAAGIVVSESGRLERLIGDLLDLARMRTRQFALAAVQTDVARAVADTADALRYEFEATGIALHVAVPTTPVLAVTDAHRIGQIVANLTENALRFATTEVIVALAERDDGSLELSVTDDGPGIPAEEQPHVFERLYTSNRSAERSAGTGVGLAIVAELTAAMGGRVTIAPGTSGGTRFIVELPVAAPRAPIG